jgi:archaellin
MAIEDLFKGDSVKGLAIGLGAAILIPVVLPVVAAVARPLARAAIKTGIMMFEKGRETVAEMSEVVEDLIAEAKAEIEQSHAARGAGEIAEAASAASEGDATR